MTSLQQTMDMLPTDHHRAGVWVFAYGSLMWRPDFSHRHVRDALLYGYHRGLCIYSHEYRGTPEKPGLVFGLNRGGSCRGRVLRIPPPDVGSVVARLYEREMINRVYIPCMTRVKTPDGSLRALTFVADPQHEQYCGALSDDEAVKLIRQGFGRGGACLDYIDNTVSHLRELGIRDRNLERLLARAR